MVFSWVENSHKKNIIIAISRTISEGLWNAVYGVVDMSICVAAAKFSILISIELVMQCVWSPCGNPAILLCNVM